MSDFRYPPQAMETAPTPRPPEPTVLKVKEAMVTLHQRMQELMAQRDTYNEMAANLSKEIAELAQGIREIGGDQRVLSPNSIGQPARGY